MRTQTYRKLKEKNPELLKQKNKIAWDNMEKEERINDFRDIEEKCDLKITQEEFEVNL